MQTVLTNAQIVLADSTVHGTVAFDGDEIAFVDAARTNGHAQDMEGDFIIPGIIDIHTDNLERHYFPRPNIDWNPTSATIAHDGVCIASGVTTVFDSLALGVGGSGGESRDLDNLRRLIDGIEAADDHGALRAEHFIHWRCELPGATLPALLDEFLPRRHTRLASLMDHTPGQRQYKNLDFFLDRTWRREGMSETMIEDRLNERRTNQERNVVANRSHLADMAHAQGVPLATHDDETPEHVAEAHAVGVRIAEFPVTLDAAREAKRLGMINVMGGPNLIRGGSYSGNVSAAELEEAGLLDGFASDYVPRSLIECAFRLTDAEYGRSLPAAVSSVTSVVANAVGLTDRGEIAPGKRADLVRVSLNGGLPVVRSVWVAGRRVA
jgi:alpha-D-ribose 1-methylphosphonate 5-triphosphate diphosphatase